MGVLDGLGCVTLLEEIQAMARRPVDSTAPDGWLSAEVALKAIDLRIDVMLAEIRAAPEAHVTHGKTRAT